MATYDSDLMTYKVPFRGAVDGQEFQVTGNIKIKAGTKLTQDDVLRFARIGHHVALRKITLSVDGELDDGTVALDGTLGWLRAYAADGTTVLVHDNKTGTTYTSPVSDPNGIIDAANSALETGILQAQGPAVRVFTEDAASGNAFEAAAATLAAAGLEGPVDIGLTITTTADGDAAADVVIRCTLDLVQRNATQGEWSGALATAYTDRYGTDNENDGLVS